MGRIMKLFAISEKSLFFVFLWITILLGAFDCVNSLGSVNPDGLSYIEMGEAFFRGDYEVALNPYWSPLYALVIGFVLYVFKPVVWYETCFIQAVNFLIFLASFFSFKYFVKHMMSFLQLSTLSKQTKNGLLFCMYALFLWGSINLVGVGLVVPDLLVNCIVYLLMGISVSIVNSENEIQSRKFLLLGVLLSLGYLAKTPLLPLGFIFLFVLFVCLRKTSKNIVRILFAATVFGAISLSWITVLSYNNDAITIGETGKLNYAWHINKLRPIYVHWQGKEEDKRFGVPIHPTRQIADDPDVFEFDNDWGVTYPPWYNAAYWYKGATPYFSFKQHCVAIGENIVLLAKIMPFPILVVLVVVLCVYAGYPHRGVKEPLKQLMPWMFVFPSVAALGMYGLVHIEDRYLASFLVLVLAVPIMICFSKTDLRHKKAMVVTVFIMSLIMMPRVFAPRMIKGISFVKNCIKYETVFFRQNYLIAKELEKYVTAEDNKVGYIGRYSAGSYWARLAGAKIIAEIPYASLRSHIEEKGKLTLSDLLPFRELPVAALLIHLPDKFCEDAFATGIEGTEYGICSLRRSDG